MKKILSLMMVLAMVLSMSAMVFAAETIQDGNGTSDIGITAGYDEATDNKQEILDGAEGTKVYYLTLSWEQAGTIRYNAGKTTYSWDQGTLTYKGTESDKGWNVTGASVTVTATNRGNADVTVTCGNPVGKNGVTAVNGSYDKNVLNLSSAATNGFDGAGAAQSESATYTISEVKGDWTGTGTIGTITVTIAPKNA